MRHERLIHEHPEGKASVPLVRPIVINSDRAWAMRQCPSWAAGDRGDAICELVDDGAWLETEKTDSVPPPDWAAFVAEQADAFERHFQETRRPYATWSRIWRKHWFLEVDWRKRFPLSAPVEFQPFFRSGTIEFARALGMATKKEKVLWQRFGVAQFKPTDKRLARVTRAANRNFR